MSSETEKVANQNLQDRIAIDQSVRLPVLFFFTSGAVWLLLACALGFLSALKMRNPGLWDDCFALTYGRLYPAHLNALIYGWAMQAGMGTMIWLMARLSRAQLRAQTTVIVAGHVWNVAVFLGILAIFFTGGTSVVWLDFPSWLWPMMALCYFFITIWVVVLYGSRREKEGYISQHYLIGAAFWFPWIYITANLIIFHFKGSAVMSAGVDTWYVSNLTFFWFTPIALAVAYYIIPKITGRPIYSYSLASFGFWTLAIVAGWMGFQRYIGGPFPAWMPAMGGTACILLLLVVITTGVNHYQTLKGKFNLVTYSPSLRFTVFGTVMFTGLGLMTAMSSYFTFGKYLQFSHAVAGMDILAVYGFFSMTMFGAIYFIVPRITGCEWPSAGMIRFHFWFSAYGIISLVAFQVVAGYFQGYDINQWSKDFMVSVNITKGHIVARAVAWLLILSANLTFAWQLLLMFAGKGRRSQGATLIHSKPGAALTSDEAAAGLAKGGAKA